MTNMSYCRFENTLAALRDCKDQVEELYTGEAAYATGDDECRKAAQLVRACADLLEIVAEHTSIDGDLPEGLAPKANPVETLLAYLTGRWSRHGVDDLASELRMLGTFLSSEEAL